MRSSLDIAEEMDKSLGSLDGIEVFGTQLLCGVFIRGSRTFSGLILPSQQKEDFWQGKVVRILKACGGTLDKMDPELFGGRVPAVGDWVFARVEDGFQMSVKGPGAQDSALFNDWQEFKGRGWPCRLIYPADLYGRVADPYTLV